VLNLTKFRRQGSSKEKFGQQPLFSWHSPFLPNSGNANIIDVTLIFHVEAVEKVPKQILGRDAEKSDLIECATINDLMLGKGQVTPENIVLTRQKDFSYRLVSKIIQIDDIGIVTELNRGKTVL
jgi:hypothetical protein